jgi:hypothetical protein
MPTPPELFTDKYDMMDQMHLLEDRELRQLEGSLTMEPDVKKAARSELLSRSEDPSVGEISNQKLSDSRLLSTEFAHSKTCDNCDARPFIAGEHHRRGCPSRSKSHIKKRPDGHDYSKKCKHCGAKPFSQGPHHDSDCKRNWSYTAYASKLAHKYRCKHCQARPFPAGPHHRSNCPRHFKI